MFTKPNGLLVHAYNAAICEDSPPPRLVVDLPCLSDPRGCVRLLCVQSRHPAAPQRGEPLGYTVEDWEFAPRAGADVGKEMHAVLGAVYNSPHAHVLGDTVYFFRKRVDGGYDLWGTWTLDGGYEKRFRNVA